MVIHYYRFPLLKECFYLVNVRVLHTLFAVGSDAITETIIRIEEDEIALSGKVASFS